MIVFVVVFLLALWGHYLTILWFCFYCQEISSQPNCQSLRDDLSFPSFFFLDLIFIFNVFDVVQICCIVSGMDYFHFSWLPYFLCPLSFGSFLFVFSFLSHYCFNCWIFFILFFWASISMLDFVLTSFPTLPGYISLYVCYSLGSFLRSLLQFTNILFFWV